jgi:two-component system sensor histidine kinase UhpB
VIILSGLSDKRIALEAIAMGAEDYLDKGEFDEKLLEKTIAYAIERKRNLERLRQANERYSLVSKATQDLIWDWDLVTDDIYRDEQAVKEVYGFSSNALIGTISEWNKRIHPDDASRLLQLIQEIKNSTHKDFFEIEYKFATEEGKYKNIHDRGYIVRNAEGRPVRLIGAAQDITERKRLEAALEESRIQRQRAVTEATIKGQENEREQLGKELHDNINQVLATSRLFLDHALSSPNIQKDSVIKSREFIILAINEIRKLSHILLPPSLQDFGLTCALTKLMDSISQAARFKINKQWDNFREQVLRKDQKLTIYRIVQEQLNNIIKHASAKNVTLSLSTSDDGEFVQLVIKDDGKGFDPDKSNTGVGLRNIKSRAELFRGQVTIQSAVGNGCELKIVFPVACN